MKKSSSDLLAHRPATRKAIPEEREAFQSPDPAPKQSLPLFREKSPTPENPSEEPEKRAAVSTAIREVVGRTPVAPTLSVLRGLKAGRIYELLGESITIGRNSHCDLVLPDEVVSRDHARLRARSDGMYIEDLGSRNGTFVNGKRIDQPTKLSDGDYIQVYELLLSYHDAAAGAAAMGDSPVVQEDLSDWSAEDSGSEPAPTNWDRTIYRPRRRGRSSAIIMTLDASWTGHERIEVNAETKLQAVLEITRNLGSTLDLDHVLSRILDSVFRFFPQADHGYILKAESKGGLRPAVIKHRERGGAPSTIRPIARTIAKQVLSEAKAILSSDVIYDQQSPEMPTSVLETEHRSMMCAPLMGPSQTPLGIIYIDTENPANPFNADDLDVLVCIAILAGQAMEQASVSEARYRAVVDAAADGILTTNDKGIIQSVNPAVEKLFGYSSQELIGEPVSRLSAQRENGHVKSRMGFFEEEQQTTLGNVRETTGRRKDGTTFPMSISVAEFELSGERLLTGIVQDITDRKRAEQDRLQAELVNIVWEQQRHFGQELHDSFGQELTGIRMLIDSLRQRLGNQDLPEAETAEELASLIRDAQAKMRSLARGLFPVEIFAHGLVSALEDLSNTIRASRQVECSFHSDGPVDVESNEVATHLFRIAQEATNNAVKHSGAKHIHISLIGKGPRLVLSIKDDGSGLPPEAMNTSSLSSGMGLRTMKYRANVVGANLTIQSAQDSSSSDASCGTIVRCVYQRDRQTESVPS